MSNNLKTILMIIDFVICTVFEGEPIFGGFYADLEKEDDEIDEGD